MADLSPEDQAILLAQRMDARPPAPMGWQSLWYIGLLDARDSLRTYVRLGFHPILVDGKVPVEKGWQNQKLDMMRLDAELEKNPRLGLGLRTGPQPSGKFLVVVDVDGPRDLLGPLETKVGERIPLTLTARTGSGGLHLYYFTKPGVELKNRAAVVPGVDLRGAGGQVVAAPSRHPNGRMYRWEHIQEPEILP